MTRYSVQVPLLTRMGKYLTGWSAGAGTQWRTPARSIKKRYRSRLRKNVRRKRGGSLKGEETGKGGIRGKTDGADKGGNKPACKSAGRRQRRTVGSDHITREVFMMRIGNNSQGIWQLFSRMNGGKANTNMLFRQWGIERQLLWQYH